MYPVTIACSIPLTFLIVGVLINVVHSTVTANDPNYTCVPYTDFASCNYPGCFETGGFCCCAKQGN